MAEKKKKSAIKKLRDGEVEILEPILPPEVKKTSEETDPSKPTLETYLSVLQQFRTKKKHLVSAPTFTPKNFYDSIQFYDTGGVRRLYLYVNNAWRYVVLT